MSAPYSGPIDLTDKIAIVTGASRGIGQATCVALSREGARIASWSSPYPVQSQDHDS